ncbi:helix-turn-helix transcriptional regulator [Antarctobacter sp.]|uniref:helix-turn-helix transcriptional regulator n=1 Tax=Antarctobacter sp. TaxID=1872577 RepID=UPI002B26BEB4|nr:helix-turn-helix domain-containing protein [Antarctobacter sp.]
MGLKTELLSIKQIADHLELGVSTIWRLVKMKKFPAPIKVGGSTRWKVQDIEDWLASQEAA